MTAFVAHRALWIAIRWLTLAAGLWQASESFAAPDAAQGIAVIFPDIGEPYRSVFTQIIDGIEEQAKGHVVRVAVGANVNAQELGAQLRRQDIHVVIALGRNGLKASAALDRDIGVVAGGVLSAPQPEARSAVVHSLAPDPALLFARLKNLLPGARRVVVVYDPHQNDWLIRLARDAARVHGLVLVATEAEDLKTATRLYRDILAAADPARDVLWLPQDTTTVEDSAVLPLVLQEAWNRSLPVISSSVTHVKRGALFALYPNNLALGRRLANSALGYLSVGSAAARGVQPLTEVLLAVNVRTANHLGIDLGGRQQSFDIVFPEP